jgi:hypothetical protein
MVVVGEDAFVITAGLPLTCDQRPVPMVGVLPLMVTTDEQITWLLPAMAVDGLSRTVICTSSVLGEQLLKLIVHLKVYMPTAKPVTVVFAWVGLVMVAAGPPTCVHCPVPVPGTLLLRVAEVARQISWSGPALESDGPDEILMVTLELLVQPLLLMVQVNT